MAITRNPDLRPTHIDRPWSEDELIVTKTDTKGIITYANKVFLRLAELSEDEAIGSPHDIIRHPDMPRCIFKLLWDTIASGKEIFVYLNNMATSGDHYWVLAHVTPTFEVGGAISGYHSNRRKPKASQIEKIDALYRRLLEEERKHSSPRDGIEAATILLQNFVREKGVSYEEFVFTI